MAILSKGIYRFIAVPIELPMAFFIDLEKFFLICMQIQKTLNSKNNLEKAEQSWRNQAPWLQTILQSYSIQNSMVLAQKQTHRSVEQHRKSRDKLTHVWSINLWQRRPEYTVKKRHLLNKWCWRNYTATCKIMKLEYSLNTIHTHTNSKWIKDLHVKLDTIKISEENWQQIGWKTGRKTGRTLININYSSIFFKSVS